MKQKKRKKKVISEAKRTRFKKWLIGSISRCKVAQENHPVYFAIFKILFIGTPALILSYATIKFSQPLPYQSAVQSFLAAKPSSVLVLLSWSLIGAIVVQVADSVVTMFSDKYSLKAFELTAFVSALDRVVGSKLERFGTYSTTDFSSERITGDHAFQNITKPDLQIENLIRNLFMLLVTLTKDNTLNIVLAKIENNLPVSWLRFMPDDNHPDNSILGDERGRSLFSHCARKKQFLHISDIEKHLQDTPQGKQQFVASELGATNIGSIICYPIIHDHTGSVIAALSIKSIRPDAVGDHFDKKYGYMINSFIKRIKLELALGIIKERVAL